MKLYHGSKDIVDHPQHGKGRKNNDYGMGFYCTESIAMAQEWSVGPDQDGFANAYDLDTTDLVLLDLNSAGYCTLHWLGLLLRNRTFTVDTRLAAEAKSYLLANFPVDTETCDYIRGYRADDSYFSFAEAFLEGAISYQDLQRAMHLGRLGQQVVLRSPKAFERLRFLEATSVSSDEWYPRRLSRDIKARRDFCTLRDAGPQKHGLFMIDILREEMRPGDERL